MLSMPVSVIFTTHSSTKAEKQNCTGVHKITEHILMVFTALNNPILGFVDSRISIFNEAFLMISSVQTLW